MANFRARARAVDLLGKQQIRDEVTAISELLRNSYDADATEGLINVDTIQETILVWDDGEGMSETDVQENWLTLGTYSKVKNNKTKKDRVKIGEKGIGRLAISLLGDQLLLISKKKDIGIWTILFLHWDLFRNEKAYLEAIKVPLRAFNSLESLLSFIKIDFDSLKKELLSNLDDSEIWEENISNKIKGDIDQFKLSEDAINKLKLNEKRGGGTLFYISSLAAAWDWSIYKSKIKDESLRRRVQRLKDVVFSFVNLIDLFDNEISYNGIEQNSLKDINVKDKNFTPKIHIDGLKLENETWFNLGDMTLFDYALKGEIINGVFNGQSIIRYPDKIETTEINNIPLTKGMYINSLKDCGPIKIKWFFLEGTEKLSSLSKDQFNTMMEKLDQMGGIFVFRDGLRILPYGEPGNDFLNIEYRRSKGAGYYLFSHRRMFGFMEISKEKNPELIDKSSREGFIENKEFNFFRTVAENLLLWWATDYLESTKDGGRRSIRNMQLTRDFERKQLQEEKKKQEEKEERQYFIKLEEYLHQFDERLKELYEQIKKEIDYEITRLRINTIEHLKNKIDVDELLYGLKNRVYAVIEKINTCFIKPNFRYNHEYYLLEAIDKCNSDIESKKHILRSYADEAILVLKSEILNKLDILLRSQDLYDNLNGKLLSIMNWIESFYKQGAEQIGFEEVRCLEKELTDFHNKIITIARNEIEEKKKYLINEQNRLKSQHNIFKLLNERLHSLEFYAEPEKLRLEIEKSITEFESTIIKVQDRKIELLDSINDSVKLKSITQFITRLNNNINNTGFFNFEDEYIGLMKKEVNMYRDLSAIGLAAELTSHEFNTLYSTIRNNLNNLHHALSETKILPYVENTKVAFNSLERLHQRMSPLYRQSRYKQKEIRLNELVVNVLEYFKADLERYEIKTILDIPPNVVIRELDTVLFTPLVNLISNAIYWTMNKETRSIYFYMSSDYESLYIHDTGMGISEKDINRIFEPFFTKKVGGRGIGLYLSRDILESRGHQLYSITPGEEPRPIGGACFCIRFNKDTMLGGNL